MSVPPGWPLLDLHNHTDRSYDAVNTLADYERAFGEGLFDVLAITDHNRIDGAVEVAEQASFPVIVGMELDTADGELIGLFLRDRIPTGLPADETARRIRDQGGLVYLQHPFYLMVRHPLAGRVREGLASAGLVDIVEGLNGGPFTAAPDARARAWAAAAELPLGAGSDAHEPPVIGTCAVAIPPGPLDAPSVLARLGSGVLVDRHRSSTRQLVTKARYRGLAEIPKRLQGEPRRRRFPPSGA